MYGYFSVGFGIIWDFSQLKICRPSPFPLRRGHIYMRDAHSAESSEKSISRFFRSLFFELWSILYSKFIKNLPILCTKTAWELLRKSFVCVFLQFLSGYQLCVHPNRPRFHTEQVEIKYFFLCLFDSYLRHFSLW